MKIKAVDSIKEFDEVKTITFERFRDHRGYFTESYNIVQFEESPMIRDTLGVTYNENLFKQANESYSERGVIRGLHFQKDMGKLVRMVHGTMVDIFMDIRPGSPNFGQIGMHYMNNAHVYSQGQWIWIPPGFAHGNAFFEDSIIEYFCTDTYKPEEEAGVNVFDEGIDWSKCDTHLKDMFDTLVEFKYYIMSTKDKEAMTLEQWKQDEKAKMFTYQPLLAVDMIGEQ